MHTKQQVARPRVDPDDLMAAVITGKRRAEFLQLLEQQLEAQEEQFQRATEQYYTDDMWEILATALREAACTTFPAGKK